MSPPGAAVPAPVNDAVVNGNTNGLLPEALEQRCNANTTTVTNSTGAAIQLPLTTLSLAIRAHRAIRSTDRLGYQ